MSIDTLTGGLVPVKLWTPLDGVEPQALGQLKNIALLPWVFSHVAVMPDVHYGKGATVGSVIAMKGALAPSAVGVDIGCGMGAVRTNLKASNLPENLAPLRAAIESAIPVGFSSHGRSMEFKVSDRVRAEFQGLFKSFNMLDEGVKDLEGRASKQVGTLGGGNHFIEVCLDNGVCDACGGTGVIEQPADQDGLAIDYYDCDGEGCKGGAVDPRVWLMLHSGSRNIGKSLAEIHIARARGLVHNQHLPDLDLAVFLSNTEDMVRYRQDLFWAQKYAFLNREFMFDLLKGVVRNYFPTVTFEDAILCHHNYVSEEIHYGEELIVTRKGAINAEAGRMGIIPGSMGTKSYIVRGLGNPESFNSASHGAGRRLSRGAAKRKFNLEDLAVQTAGIECRKDAGVIDEIPGAYKPIEEVMANQKDLVEIVHELRQVLCVKG